MSFLSKVSPLAIRQILKNLSNNGHLRLAEYLLLSNFDPVNQRPIRPSEAGAVNLPTEQRVLQHLRGDLRDVRSNAIPGRDQGHLAPNTIRRQQVLHLHQDV